MPDPDSGWQGWTTCRDVPATLEESLARFSYTYRCNIHDTPHTNRRNEKGTCDNFYCVQDKRTEISNLILYGQLKGTIHVVDTEAISLLQSLEILFAM